MWKEDLSTGEYHLPGDTTTGAVLFDDTHYSDAGVSNNHYLHLENAVTRGVGTEYSKLGCDGSTSADRHNTNNPYSSLNHLGVPHATDSGSNMLPCCDKQEYSILSHHPALFTNGDNSHKLSHNDTTLQEYSSLNHQQPTTHTECNNSTEQQYSSLQHTALQEYSILSHHSMQSTTYTDINKSTEQQYSSLQHTTMFLTSNDQ